MTPILRVALATPLPQLFDYLPPAGATADAGWVGCRVRVPFGRRELVGLVAEVGPPAASLDALRPALARLDLEPVVPAELLASVGWAARYYQHPLGDALIGALPTALRTGAALPATGEPWVRLAREPARPPRAGTRGAALLDRLRDGAVAQARLDLELAGWRAAARAWLADGTLAIERRAPALGSADIGPPPNAAQQRAIDAVRAAFGRFEAFLLEGVTGSGKTEVYLTLIAELVAQGRQCLVLVPEIGLTPQMLARFRARLPCRVVAVHSALSEGERAAAWAAALDGSAGVVIGTRSAVFAPLRHAGLIVVDEEHDASFKQQDGFRYSARDLALVRAKALGVPVVLGSATPTLESLHHAQTGRYTLLDLPERAGPARPPAVRVLDLRRQRLFDGLCTELIDAIAACLARGEQALVFRNRRGFAPVLLCHACGWHPRCARCERPMTLHRGAGELRCHHCDAAQRAPRACPDCRAAELVPLGTGTERLDVALAERFPGVPLLRFDRDTTRRKDAFAQRLAEIPHAGAALLVGTQMLAKGHDLSNLTLVAVVGVDEALFSADFRAAERLAQLLIQVAGRAGRAEKPGVVYLQTHHPQHPMLERLVREGYRAFADAELAERRALAFPPYAHLALLRAEGADAARVGAFLSDAAASARALRESVAGGAEVEIQGPIPAPMALRAGAHRAQVLLQAPRRGSLHALLEPWVDALRADPRSRRVRWSIDVDPADLY